MLSLPNDFVLGVATSAYQIEGGSDERGRSIWDDFCEIPGNIARGETGVVASDHFHRFKEDVALMYELGIRAYRFSLSWPRLFPTGQGPVSQKGIDFYKALLDELNRFHIEPYITLYHWDLPSALQKKGGWTNPDIVKRFVEFADEASRQLKSNHWFTINEPYLVAFLGHQTGEHAPGVKDPVLARKCLSNLIEAHFQASEAIRANSPQCLVGIAVNLSPVYAETEEDQLAAKEHDRLLYHEILDPLYGKGSFVGEKRVPPDFLGINYYSRLIVKRPVTAGMAHIIPSPPNPYSSMWEFYPTGLSEILERVQRDYNPSQIYISENGTALGLGVDDTYRISYLKAHLEIARKFSVKGYFVWSLLDNFEWTFGYEKRFGLIEVDFSSQKRTIRSSGHWVGALSRAVFLHKIPFPLLEHRPKTTSNMEACIILHGLGENRCGIHYLHRELSESLVECGFTVFRFDLAGCGDSSMTLSFKNWKDQLQKVIDFLSSFEQVHLIARGISSLLLSQHSRGKTIAINPPEPSLFFAQVDRIPLEPIEDLWVPKFSLISVEEEQFWTSLGVESSCLGGFCLSRGFVDEIKREMTEWNGLQIKKNSLFLLEAERKELIGKIYELLNV